jgi:hypothetical protein
VAIPLEKRCFLPQGNSASKTPAKDKTLIQIKVKLPENWSLACNSRRGPKSQNGPESNSRAEDCIYANGCSRSRWLNGLQAMEQVNLCFPSSQNDQVNLCR